ncbi:MetQ/NlpA family ABC transporter substrate-binding protein [Microbacterium sp. JZ31]|uniref:MetQ/NlpA family ABC transporter substrate-binding protein n=1 Tax=Microbacterium sp. JZ31 TaxID=1906274 RepID=UPI001931F03B|nr:MetQ/NlpA family ABC transporter substrate-binding protein [Microbacterium sp. JZ31]
MSRSTRIRLLGLAAVAASAAALTACTGATDAEPEAAAAAGEPAVIRIGSMFPATEVLEFVNENLAEEAGFTLEITEFSEYTIVNESLADGSLDANLYQHQPYLDNFNEEHGTDIVSVGKVYFPALALYSLSLDSIEDIPDGTEIPLPADPANLGRSLELLAAGGLIETTDAPADLDDITANPKDLEFALVDAAQLPRALEDTDAGVVNFVYAGPAGLTKDDQLLQEEVEGSPYANRLAVNAGDEDEPEIQALLEALNSDETSAFIEENWSGLVIPVSGD